MEYYKRRKEAIDLIDKLYSEGCDTDLIGYNLTNLYGLGDVFVKRRIEQLKKFSPVKEEVKQI